MCWSPPGEAAATGVSVFGHCLHISFGAPLHVYTQTQLIRSSCNLGGCRAEGHFLGWGILEAVVCQHVLGLGCCFSSDDTSPSNMGSGQPVCVWVVASIQPGVPQGRHPGKGQTHPVVGIPISCFGRLWEVGVEALRFAPRGGGLGRQRCKSHGESTAFGV